MWIETEQADKVETTVAIVGAGPVGLTLALLLSAHGIQSVLIDENPEPSIHSRAIGIMPPSLGILSRVDMDQELCRHGVKITRAVLHSEHAVAARLDFSTLGAPYPFILSLPQVDTERALLEKLRSENVCTVMMGQKAEQVHIDGQRVTVCAANGEGKRIRLSARYLCGCDGKSSTVRDAVVGRGKSYHYPQTFGMGDFVDDTDMAEEAHLYFTTSGSVESFPLPNGARRWIVQTSQAYASPPDGVIERLVFERTGHDLSVASSSGKSSFGIQRTSARRLARPPVFLAGDAAHTIPPIGGQGMNVGLADAEYLADLLAIALRAGQLDCRLVGQYERDRTRVARVAGRRSVAGMRVGTASGAVASRLRSALLLAALHTRLEETVKRHFAMLSAPHKRSPWRAQARPV